MHNSRRNSQPRNEGRDAFTVVEVLVLLALIAVLIALLLPAVQAAREAARRTRCAANLKQIGIAVAAYESVHRMFPPGNSNAGMLVAILPYIDQRPLYERWNFKTTSNNPSMDGNNQKIMQVKIPLYLCPSDPAPPAWPLGDRNEAAASFAGNCGTGVLKYGYNGMFRNLDYAPRGMRAGPIRASDVRNGLSNTAAVSEILHGDGTYARLRVNWDTPKRFSDPGQLDEFAAYCAAIPPIPTDYGWRGDSRNRGLPWTDGNIGCTMYNHILAPNQPSCMNGGDIQSAIVSAGSAHSGGVNLIYGDGHGAFIGDSIDIGVWRGMGARVDSDLTASN